MENEKTRKEVLNFISKVNELLKNQDPIIERKLQIIREGICDEYSKSIELEYENYCSYEEGFIKSNKVFKFPDNGELNKNRILDFLVSQENLKINELKSLLDLIGENEGYELVKEVLYYYYAKKYKMTTIAYKLKISLNTVYVYRRKGWIAIACIMDTDKVKKIMSLGENKNEEE